MKWALSVLVALSFSSRVWAEDPVYFADANLKAIIENELWISDPTPADMLGLTRLVCPNAHDRPNAITDLTGLEYAVNLDTLNLRYHRIDDISPLAGLTNLRTLVLNNNQISDLSPLAALTGLHHLDAHDNLICDVSALSNLTNLQTLILRINRISDLSGLSALTKLEKLDLQWNRIRELSPLAGLANLRVLILRYNSISDVGPLAGLPRLQELILVGNQISDISALTTLTTLQELGLNDNPLSQVARDATIPQIMANNPGVWISYDSQLGQRLSVCPATGGSIIDPGAGEFTYDYGVSVRIEAQPEPGFIFAGWSGTYSTMMNPAFLTMDRDYEMQANFASLLKTLHVDDDAPNDPGPGDPNDGDPDENGTAEHPYDRIQEAIDVAAEGATVVVHPGTYHESINLLGKSIHLTGIEPNGAPLPVIDGDGTGPIVSLVSGEDPNCMLTGFVLTAGKGKEAGAIMCSQSSPTVANCLIVGNRATTPQGAAVYCEHSGAVFDNCTLADNVGGEQGAGLMLVDSDVVLSNSIVWGNTPNQIALSGDSIPSIIYSDISGGWLDLGNIEADPLFAQRGQWVTSADPNELLWTTGDYHLQSQAGRWDGKTQAWVQDDATSPCIDTGDAAAPVGAEPVPNGGIVNLGAYGGTTQASKTPPGDPSASIRIPDANLKALIENELWVSDPTPADMLGLTRLVCPNGYDRPNAITDLTGLEYATNLDTLNLRYHWIDDISPLAGLTNLRSLVLNNNLISDLSPLAALTGLHYLDVHDNLICDVSALSNVTNLQTLVLRINRISDLSGLSALTKLEELDLQWNRIRELSPLAGLANLRVLILRYNSISDMGPLAGLPCLQELILVGNQISDISALTTLTTLQELGLNDNPLSQVARDVTIPQIMANNPGLEVSYDW